MMFYQWVQESLLFQPVLEVHQDQLDQQDQEALEVQLVLKALCLLVPQTKGENLNQMYRNCSLQTYLKEQSTKRNDRYCHLRLFQV